MKALFIYIYFLSNFYSLHRWCFAVFYNFFDINNVCDSFTFFGPWSLQLFFLVSALLSHPPRLDGLCSYTCETLAAVSFLATAWVWLDRIDVKTEGTGLGTGFIA